MYANVCLHLALPLLVCSSTTKIPMYGAFYVVGCFGMLLYGDNHIITMVPYQNKTQGYAVTGLS